MFGFSIPKLLLLLFILLIIWNLFKFLENKAKNKVSRENKKQTEDDETLTECTACGSFYDKSIKGSCPICGNAIKK